MSEKELPIEALAKLRAPFEPHQISKKPQPTKKDNPKGKCSECGGWHGLPAIHLDYVGHAALTHRLLDVDPMWSWEPLAYDAKGLPALDGDGGLWIKLTICGVSRLGYGDAQGKAGPDATKERIGDALRNAGMRFGAALDLWHKGVLEMDPERFEPSAADKWVMKAGGAATQADLQAVWVEGVAELSEKGDRAAYDEFKAAVGARKKELAEVQP
jgi:hypothetical protein